MKNVPKTTIGVAVIAEGYDLADLTCAQILQAVTCRF